VFSITTKKDYWTYLNSGAAKPGKGSLKDIQDAFILYELRDLQGKRILEVGGGASRVLPKLVGRNECWNADKFEGLGAGPKSPGSQAGIRIVNAYMGEFSKDIPDGYFDVVMSISVIEHVSSDRFPAMIKDCHRALKPDGLMLHAIDLYLLDDPLQHRHGERQRERLRLYRTIPDIVGGGFDWIEPPEADENARANASLAANSVDTLHAWNSIAPALREVRAISASCNLAVGVRKRL
jgi:SAM-dependent methyltransferase